MKKTIISIFAMVAIVATQAQPNFTYCHHINQAELQAIAGQYPAALAQFDSAFATERRIFGKDLYNALLCASRLGDTKRAARYFEQLLRRGYPADSIGSNPQFAAFAATKQYKKLAQQQRAGQLNSDTLVIPALQGLMDTLHNDDQNFRKRNGGNYINSEYIRVIRLLDSINAYKLVAAIARYGFPNEFNCGIKAWYYSAPYIVIIHQVYGGKSRQIDFAPYLLTAIKSRQVLPNVGLGLYSRVAGRDSLFGIDCFFRVKQKKGGYKYAYYPSYSPELEAKFNQNRREYGLEPLDDYRKKILYWLNNKDFAFEFRQGVHTNTIDEEVVPYFKGLTYIE